MLLYKVRLINYGGIYNGMNINELQIDFTKCKNRIIVIKGDNGSGKSTLMNALTPLPDSNSEFIDGLTAIKEISYYDDKTNELYEIKYIHEVKPNGERSTTKGYIRKGLINYPSSAIELNPSGNITSCKEVIYDEFQLDPNYITLTQLSATKRGLADLKPADRKRFVNSILDNISVYNDMYKKLNKKSSLYKNLMNSIVSKLNTIGDPIKLKYEYDALCSSITEYNNKLTELMDKRSKAETIIDLSSRTSIMSSINVYKNKLKSIDKELNKCNSIPSNMIVDNDLNKTLEIYMEEKISTEKHNEEIINQIYILLESNNRLSSQISSLNENIKESKIKDIVDELDMKETLTTSSMDKVKKELWENYKIDVCDDYIQFRVDNLESIKNKILKRIDDFYISISNMSLSAINHYKDNNIYNAKMSDKEYIDIIKASDVEIERIENDIRMLGITCYKNDIDNMSKTCKSECPVINYIKNVMAKELETDKKLNDILNNEKFNNHLYNESYEIYKYMNNLIEFIEDEFRGNRLYFISGTHEGKNIKRPYIFDRIELIDTIINRKNLPIIETIEFNKRIESLKMDYHINKELLYTIEAHKRECQSSIDLYNNIVEKISNMTAEFKYNEEKINMGRTSIDENTDHIKNLSSKIDTLRKLIEKDNVTFELNKLLSQNEEIVNTMNVLEECNKQIEKYTNILRPIIEKKDEIQYNIRITNQYIQELNDYKNIADKIEIVKYSTSPTTGIQTLFASMYLDKIINNANDILSKLFGGNFILLPFILTDNEFRIPVAVKNGINHDDITSMSSAQISLISMIISISLLSQTSTRLNIIKGDEIDAPFDSHNRRMFFDILNLLMSIIDASQCILISHNSELSQTECDVIQLISSHTDIDNTSSNIIWDYNFR